MPNMIDELQDEFDQEDYKTLREVIDDHRSRKAVQEKLKIWGKYLVVLSGVLIALTQLRGWVRDALQWIQMK